MSQDAVNGQQTRLCADAWRRQRRRRQLRRRQRVRGFAFVAALAHFSFWVGAHGLQLMRTCGVGINCMWPVLHDAVLQLPIQWARASWNNQVETVGSL